MHDNPPSLAGRRVMLIEENEFLAGYLTTVLQEAGVQVLGPARTIQDANVLMTQVEPVPDVAVISTDIFEAYGFSGCEKLVEGGVAILLTARRPRTATPASSVHSLLVAPFAGYQVVDHVRQVLQQVTGPQ
jgi:DNA-binding response OmpR family regulator